MIFPRMQYSEHNHPSGAYLKIDFSMTIAYIQLKVQMIDRLFYWTLIFIILSLTIFTKFFYHIFHMV